MFQSELHESQAFTNPAQTSNGQSDIAHSDTPNHDIVNDNQAEYTETAHVRRAPANVPLTPVHIDENMFNPPQVQRMNVVHASEVSGLALAPAFTPCVVGF